MPQVEWVPEAGIDCVLKSQLIRMLAFRHPAVADKDVVVTADVNLFVMTREILTPLMDYTDMETWILQYHDTAYSETGNGQCPRRKSILGRASLVW